MLRQDDRRTLLEALRPPEGYDLDYAVGTTYTLDLLALLLTPTAFTLFELQGTGRERGPDPAALLTAVRDYAHRMIVFCEAGRISVPSRFRLLFSYLESSVCQVSAPREGRAFHPKVWLLRYKSSSAPVVYRLLVLSRNLTFDRSWDVMLVLEGELTSGKRAVRRNHGLGDFVAALSEMGSTLTEGQRRVLKRVQDEVQRVQFQLPENFNTLRFYPLGIPGYHHWPFDDLLHQLDQRPDRMLIISPFLSDGCLLQLAAQGRGHVLVSRPESIARLRPETVAAFEHVAVLDDATEAEAADDAPADDEDADDQAAYDEAAAALDNQDLAGILGKTGDLSGLHAKLFVAEAGQTAWLFVGSANATDAAFSGNVEFVVALIGSRNRCGVDAVLGQGRGGIGDLLRPYSLAGEDPEDDPLERELQGRLDAARHTLAAAPLFVRVEATGDDLYTLSLCAETGARIALDDDVQIRCRPVSLAVEQGLASAESGLLASFPGVPFPSITSFFAFRISVRKQGRVLEDAFVLNVPLQGAPEHRRERLLRHMLQDQRQFLRMVLLMLAESGLDVYDALDLLQRTESPGSDGRAAEAPLPLLEVMLRTLDRDPQKLDRVARLVEDLRQLPNSPSILPDGFELVWEPIWRVRQEVKEP